MSEQKDKPEGAITIETSEGKKTDAYGKIYIELTAEELTQTGTQKLIVNDLFECKEKIKKLEKVQELYHNEVTEKSVLKEKLLKSERGEALYGFCLMAGGVIIGVSPLIYKISKWTAVIIFGIGLILLAGATLFKIFFRK